MKKTKLFLFTLCLISVLVLLVSCNEENYNEGFSVKTPSRATATTEASATSDGISDSTESGATLAPTATPTMNENEFGEEVLLPTPPADEDTDTDATANVTGDSSDVTTTGTPSAETATPTQQPVTQVTPAEKTGINLPPIWFNK